MNEQQCQKKTDHARVAGTDFCKCGHVQFIKDVPCCSHTHVMHDIDPKTQIPKERCNETRGGGGRYCLAAKGHKGDGHVFQCGI